MANKDKVRMLLQAVIDDASIQNIKNQISGIQNTAKPINLQVNTAQGTANVQNMADAIEKLEMVTKKNLSLDLKRLSVRYKNLIDPNTVIEIQKMIDALNASDPKLKHSIDLIKVKMKEVSIGAEESRKSLDLANKSAMSFGEAMKTAAYKFGIWSIITASYYKMIREIAKGVKTVHEMNAALTEIGMVTNQTREQTAHLAKEYNNLAKELKVLTSDVTSAAVTFYRQGLSQEKVLERLRTTTMYSKIANVEFETSAHLLTATVNSMGVEIERASDVFLLLGDSTATSGEEIARGFAKTSGAAAALNLEFEKVASWIAAISARTRESAETIGTFLNTFLSRISRMTISGFDEEDGTTINDVAKALHRVGIELMDADGNLNDIGETVDLVASKFHTFNDETKSLIASAMAGTRGLSRFYNLMEGYADSLDLYEQSLDAVGTTQSKFQIYLESNQATLDNFRATIEGLWFTIIDSDSLMNVVKVATSFFDTLDSLVQRFGTLQSILAIVIPLIGIQYLKSVLSATKATVALSLAKAGVTEHTVSFVNGLRILIGELLGTTTVIEGTTVAFTGLNAAAGLLAIGLIAIPFILTKIAQKSREAKEAFDKAVRTSQELNEEVKLLEELINKQENLLKVENKSAEQKEELIKVQKELAKLYPEVATGVDEEGNKLAENIDLTKKLTEEKRKLLEQQLLAIKMEADVRLPELEKNLEDMRKEAEEIQKKLLSGDTMGTKKIMGFDTAIDETDKLKNRLLELTDAIQEDTKEVLKLKEGVASYNTILEENAERLKWQKAEELEKQAIMATNSWQLRQIEKELRELGFTSNDVSNILSGNLDKVRKNYNTLTDAQIANLISIQELNKADYQATMTRLNNSKELTKELIEDTKKRIQLLQEEMRALIGTTGAQGGTDLVVSAERRRLYELEQRLRNINEAFANVKNISITTGGIKYPKESSSKSSTKDSRQFLDSMDAEIRAIKIKNDNLLKTRDLLKEQYDLAKKDDSLEGIKRQHELIGKTIENNTQIIQSFKHEQDLLHQRANDIRKEYAQYNIDSWFDANAEQTIEFINQHRAATKEQQEEMDKLFTWVQKLKKAWMEANEEIKVANKELTVLNENIEDIRQQSIDIWIKEQNKLYQEQQDRLKSLEQIQERIVAIIRKRGEEEKKALDEAHSAEMQSLEDRHKTRMDNYKEELDEFKKTIQGMIDALDEQYEEEDYREQLEKERLEAVRLQKEIDVRSLDDTLEARNKVLELRESLAEQNEKIAKLQQKRERDLLKKSLQDQLKDKEEDIKSREKIADNVYDNERKRLEEDYRINKEYLERKYSDEQVYAEARKSIMRGQVEVAEGVFEDIYDAFVDFENKFGRGMGILGDIIKNDFIKELEKAQAIVEEMERGTFRQLSQYDSDYKPTKDDGWEDPTPSKPKTKTETKTGKVSDMTQSDYNVYVLLKETWELAKKQGNQEAMDGIHKSAVRLRDKYNIKEDLYNYDYLKNITLDELRRREYGYRFGGKITDTGTLIAPFHGTQSSPEWILNDAQLRKTINNATLSTVNAIIPKLPTLNAGQMIQVEKLINVEGNVTRDVLPLIEKAGNKVMENLQVVLNKGGVVRPVKV